MRSPSNNNSSFPALLSAIPVIWLLFVLPATAQDWRVSAGYSLKNYDILYTKAPSYGGDIGSLKKGALQLEVERYLLFGIYAAGQLDVLLHNSEGPLLGGAANFQQANAGAIVGLQWPKWGVYAGVGAGHLWNIRFRGTNSDGDRIWLKPRGSAAGWTTSLKGGIKYYLLSFLRLQMEVKSINSMPSDLSAQVTGSETTELSSFSFKPYTLTFGISLSIPWHTRKYNRSARPGRPLPELRNVKEVTFNSPMPSGAVITSPYGSRGLRSHEGIDLDAERGDPVMAAADGIVVIAGKGTGYGKMIKIRHGAGYSTVYAHLSGVHVKYGQEVKRGEIIGSAGSTGTSSGPHLHFEIIHDGKHQNPQTYIRF